MKTRLLFVPLLLALVASLAACGGGGTNVPSDAVALVNGVKIPVTDFNEYLAQAIARAVASGQPKPVPGTQAYTQARDQTIAELVQVEEIKQQATKENVSVTPKDVSKFLSNFISTNFGGSQTKFAAWMKTQGLTKDLAQKEVFVQLLVNKIKAKVTASAKVTTADEKAYYDANRTQFTTPQTLQIAASKRLANSIEQKLRNGASFAKLAKQYSQDPGSAAQGGKYTATQGKEVPAYDQAAFSLRTGELSQPIDATSQANGGFGFFIIKALGPVKKANGQETRDVEHILVAVKSKSKPETFKQAQATIKQTLLQQKQDQLFGAWVSQLAQQYQGKVVYQSGYAPPTTSSVSSTDIAPATTG